MSNLKPNECDVLEGIDYDKYTLSSLFDLGWKLQLGLEKQENEESTSSSAYQHRRARLIDLFKKCEFMLEELHIYSSNEDLDEISTNELRYMMIYAFLAWLHTKVSATKPQLRVPELVAARDYFRKFLTLTKSYGLHSFEFEKKSITQEQESNMSAQAAFDHNLINQAYERNEKIRRYKEQKELESQLASMHPALAAPHLDEEQRRKCYTTFLRYWINKSIDDLKLANDEIKLLESMNSPDVDESRPRAAAATTVPSKPFVLTRDAVQAKVFGAGYPSRPVYSIDEFYDQLVAKGMMPESGHEHAHPHPHTEKSDAPVQIGGGVTEIQKEQEKAEKDELEDRDDKEHLRKQREWDEFKDDTKRGSGNRYNRS